MKILEGIVIPPGGSSIVFKFEDGEEEILSLPIGLFDGYQKKIGPTEAIVMVLASALLSATNRIQALEDRQKAS